MQCEPGDDTPDYQDTQTFDTNLSSRVLFLLQGNDRDYQAM